MQQVTFESKQQAHEFFTALGENLKASQNKIFKFGGQQWNFDKTPEVTPKLISAVLVSENNVLYVIANLSNDTVYANIDLEDNISGFTYSELEKSVLLSNLVYVILEDYTKFMFCKDEK